MSKENGYDFTLLEYSDVRFCYILSKVEVSIPLYLCMWLCIKKIVVEILLDSQFLYSVSRLIITKNWSRIRFGKRGIN